MHTCGCIEYYIVFVYYDVSFAVLHTSVYVRVGPDRPNLTVPKVVVAGIHQSVKIRCSVQEAADVDESSGFELEWKGVSEFHTSYTYI